MTRWQAILVQVIAGIIVLALSLVVDSFIGRIETHCVSDSNSSSGVVVVIEGDNSGDITVEMPHEPDCG